jgi:hypothetical protein
MNTGFSVYDYNAETNEVDFKLDISTHMNLVELELILTGIEKLVGAIDLKVSCNENKDTYRQSLKRILSAVSDNLGFQGGYYISNPEIRVNYNKNDECVVMDEDKKKVLKIFIDEL